MESPVWLRQAQRAAKPYLFKNQIAWKHNLLNGSILFLLLAAIGLCLWVGYVQPISLWILFPLLSCAYAWLFFSIAILGVHESCHNMLFKVKNPRKQKILHWAIGNLISTPLGVNYHYFWEIGHIEHHIDPLVEDDTQNCPSVILGGKKLVSAIALLLLCPGYGFWVTTRCPTKMSVPHHFLHYFAVASFWGLYGLLSWYSGNMVNFFAMLLGLHLMGCLNLIKISMEHGCGLIKEENPLLRTRSSFFSLRWIFMPFNISIHWEHHLVSAIPWYLLPAYHEALKKTIPVEVQSNLWNEGDVFKQLKGDKVMASPK